MPNAIIRHATLSDLSSLQMILQTSSHDWRASQLTMCFCDDYLQWVIEVEAVIFGFVIIKKIIDHWELQQIVIDQKWQGHGFSKQLLLAVIDEAKKNHIQTIQLEVRASNVVARGLYEKCGFVIVGMRKKYYADGEDAILMDCALSH